MRLQRLARAAFALACAAITGATAAQVSMSATGSYTQNFNTLANTGTTNAWTDNSTIANWYWQNTGTGTTYAADAGTGTGGNKYSYGSAASTDRAMGSLGSGNAAAGSFAWGVLLQNNSAQTITNITVAYTGEQWRNSAAAGQAIGFYYKTSASIITALNPNSNGTWTAVTGLNFTSPVTGGTAGALDGNAGANRTVIAATAIPSLALAPGSYIMLKWDDPDHTGTDHGLSIDDVTINYTVSAPVLTSSNITFSGLTTSSVGVNLAGGTGVGRIVVAKAGSPVTFSPTNGNTYSGANSDFTLGNNLGGGNIFVYNGSGSSVTVTNLQPSTTYYFATWDYDGSNTYSTPAGTNNITTPGPILYTSGTYSQDFNTLPNTGTITPGVPGPVYANLSPVNAGSMGGWQYTRISGSNANVLFAVNDGSGSSGSVYSYGTGTNSDRAFGLLASAANVDAIGAVIRNTSGGPLTTFTISFTGEQWRVANAAQQALAFSYSLNGSDIATGTYTPVTQLNFLSPQVSGTAAALDGNQAANQVTVSYTVDMGTNWLPGTDLVIKWSDADDTGADHGLAIDNFSFSASGPVAPSTQDHDIAFANITTVGADVSWVNGDGSKRMVVMNTANSFTNPTNGTEATGNNVYGGGEQVIYVGTGSTVSVSNLTASTPYYVRVFGYNGLGVSSVYNTSTATLNPNNFTTATPIPPTQLVITSINGGVDPIQDAPPLFPHTFSITVQAQDGSNSPQNVLTNTTVTLSLNTGNGILGGTLTGVITAGTNQVTITGITYDTGETGVVVDATATSGDPLSATTSAPFTVLGVATNLNLVNMPTTGLVNTAVATFQVQALRDDATIDVNYNGQITVGLLSGPGTIGGTTQVNAVNGVATFSNVTFSAAGPYQIEATANGLFSANSGIIYITLPATMTELVVPKYMGSKSASGANATRTPFAVCLQFDNLVPNTQYDVRAGLGLTSDASNSYGAGNIWNGSLYGTGNVTGAFTSDANGSSGPYWLFIQPTGNATRFSAGQVHNLRISTMISGNSSPTSPQFIGSKTITALDIAPTALTPATTDDGAYVRGTSQACLSGKMILVYDNAAGTGDPLSVYQAITTTPTDATAGNYSSHPASISDTYRQTGTAVAGDYVGVTPIGANNPNGVRRIEARNTDNTLFNAITDADGIWPGGADFTSIARRAVGTIGGVNDPHLDTAPAVTTGTYGPTCSNEADITLGGAPASGVWTGTGVSGTGPYAFSPSAGTQTLTYTYTDNNGCVSSGTTSITVNTPTVVSCPGNSSVCVDAAAYSLNNSGENPTGGTFTGTGVSGNSFDPAVAGVGTHTITYSYTDGNSCTSTCQFTITVNALPVITCPGNSSVCVDAAAYSLNNSGENPTGGNFSGTGVSGNSFDPAAAGAGTHTITYSYTDGNSCTASCQFTITVNALPVVTCPGNSNVCVDAAAYSLNNSGENPTGGTFSGTGVSGNSFDPTLAGVGTHTITYSYTDGNSCTASCQFTITVNALPVVTCPANITGICTSDAAFALSGGSPAGGTYSGAGVSGGNFDPAVAGAGVHTITYTYSDGNNCSSSCNFTITVTQATTWYSDQVDGDGLGDPNVSVMACTQPTGYVADNSDLCPTISGTVGSACNDNNPFTTGDVLNASCVCTGTPVPCDNWTLTFSQGAENNDDTWQIVDANSPFVLASGGPYAANSVNTVNVCVPQGACFNLNVTDNSANGLNGGGWSLMDNNGRRILDNENNGSAFLVTAGTAEPFCNEPASGQTLIATQCDKENWLNTDVIIASADPAVSAQWGIGDQTDDGYQFWFQNPVGGYTRKVFRNHATSGGNGPANALRATKLALATIVSNPLPSGTLLNVRIRTRVNGVNGKWGPVCRFRIDPNACTTTRLNDTQSDPHFTCGVTGKTVNAGGDAGKLFAKVVTSGGSPATNYRFEITQPGQGYARTATSTNAALVLAQWVSNPLLCGTWTYNVRVQASFDGGNSYCPYGDVCTVGITNNLASPLCAPSGSFTANGSHMPVLGEVDVTMYPNPNRGDQLFLTLNGLDASIANVTMEVYDSFGKRVLGRQFASTGSQLNTVIDLNSDMAAGLYLVNITAGGSTRTERLVIER